MAKASMENGTWGELRTLNHHQIIERMIKVGKGVRLRFRLSMNPESTEWVIIPKADYDEIGFKQDKINTLEMKLKTIMNVAEL
jgi:hypothetical protein